MRRPGVPAVARGVDRRRTPGVNPAVMMNDTLFNVLNDWVDVTTAIVLLLPIWPTRNCCAKAGSTGCIEPITESRFGLSVQREGGGNG